ncbi:phytoene desaturase family protein [Methanocella arvoryzae]|uniref:Predicted amine oxidase n=1 Tax=Methanocella arvoryzae (strain DSM 22066 / NBRC 105507 / MRE50) TaxID=351160 RepID=Q0W4L9_METAR|nr:NAD(P)/FAD-dependent oxidoreductase [Methanocella arvoryzae]CAJ36674.1 predicted amine oxidase [Methanocella arvoryzae MRE50]
MKIAVIGAGLGGLLSAAALSKEHDVTVYEQLDMYGGRFTNLPYKGFQLTTGAFHMIPHGPTGPLALLLKDVGADVEIVRSKPEGTVLMQDGKLVSAMNFVDVLSPATKLKVPLLAMKALGQKTGTAADFLKGFPDMLPLADSFCGWALSATAANTPMEEIAAILKNMQKYGMPGIPMGGCSGVVDALAGVVEDNGGRINLSTRVDAVKVEDGRATGVSVAGQNVPVDAVISNIGHQLTSKLYDRKYLEPKYAEVLTKVKPSAGIKICLAAEEPLVGHPGVLFTPYTRRVNGINEVTHTDPSLAPKGMHLTMSHQTLRSADMQQEIKLGLEDLKKIFPGKKYSVLMVQSYKDDWPVNRISSGYDLGNLTPVKGLFVVGDGAKGKGGIEVEGVALGVRNMLELFEKAYG